MFIRIFRRLFVSLCFISLVSIGLLVYFQDYLVFPQLQFQLTNPQPESSYQIAPKNGEIFYLTAADGTKIQAASLRSNGSKKVVALFHGNGGTIQRFYPYMDSLAGAGFTVYQLEYRGYGGSGGWPSLGLLVSDGEMLLKHVSEKEGVPIEEITPFGISLGTGIAAQLAANHQSKALALVSPYTSLKRAAQNRPIIGVFASLLHNDIDSIGNIASLKSTCVVAAHGTLDAIINVEQSEDLQEAYKGTNKYTLLLTPGANHNNAYWQNELEFLRLLKNCAN